MTDNSVVVSWIRRTRIDGDSWASTDVPLGEEVERYLVRVIAGTVVLREVEVSTSNWVYSADMQLADAVSVPFDVTVAQISVAFGPGPAAIVQVV
ncbi:MAG: hypothetical protein ABI832_07555 [bacterium]